MDDNKTELYAMACRLLETAGGGNTSDAEQAIQHLVEASRKGHEEASKLLKKCIAEKHCGITEKNLDEVKWCVETDPTEKALRIAASKVYHQLKPDDENVKFSTTKYFERVKDFATEKKEKKFLVSTGNKLQNHDEVMEEDFVETVTRRMRSGQIDPTVNELEMAAYSQASLTRKITKYPGVTMTIAADTVIEGIATDGVGLVMTLIPFDQLYILIAFFILSMFSFKWLFSVFSVVSFYFLLAIMIITSVQMYKTKKKEREVFVMAQMLRQYNNDVNPKKVVAMFTKNSMRPYWTFLISLPFFLVAFYTASKIWIPCSELVALSWVFSVGTLVILSKGTGDEPLLKSVYVVTVLSSFPVIFHGFPRLPLIFFLIEFLTSDLASIALLYGFTLNINICSLAYLAIPGLMIKSAVRKSWGDVYSVIIPHIIGVIWWELGLVFYQDATWIGLARGSLGWPAFIILLPVISVAGFFYGVYYLFWHLGLATLIKVGVTIALLAIPILLSVWQESGFSAGKLSLRGKSLKVKLAVIFIPLLLIAAGTIFAGDEDDSDLSTNLVSWELYRDLCSEPAWERRNMAAAQVACAELKNMAVDWTGRVESVTVTQIENSAEDFLSSLPDDLAEWMRCLYGDPWSATDDDVDDDDNGHDDENDVVIGTNAEDETGDDEEELQNENDFNFDMPSDDDTRFDESNILSENVSDDMKSDVDSDAEDDVMTEDNIDSGDEDDFEVDADTELVKSNDDLLDENSDRNDEDETASVDIENELSDVDDDNGHDDDHDVIIGANDEDKTGDDEEELQNENELNFDLPNDDDDMRFDASIIQSENLSDDTGSEVDSDAEDDVITEDNIDAGDEGDFEVDADTELDKSNDDLLAENSSRTDEEETASVDIENELSEADDGGTPNEVFANNDEGDLQHQNEVTASDDEVPKENDVAEDEDNVGVDEGVPQPVNDDDDEQVDNDVESDESNITGDDDDLPTQNEMVQSNENIAVETDKDVNRKEYLSVQEGLQRKKMVLLKRYGRTCHMNAHTSYSFLLQVAMETHTSNRDITIPVVADNGFKKSLISLKQGDVINFQGVLGTNLGSSSPEISLSHLKCLTCLGIKEDIEGHKEGGHLMRLFSEAILRTLNFFTSPLISLDS